MIKQYDIFGDVHSTDEHGNIIRHPDTNDDNLTPCDMCGTLCEADCCSDECAEKWVEKYLP
jgi:hypothetical protein